MQLKNRECIEKCVYYKRTSCVTSISSKIILHIINSFINFLAECFSFFSSLSFSLDSLIILVLATDVFISSVDGVSQTGIWMVGGVSSGIISGLFCGTLTASVLVWLGRF